MVSSVVPVHANRHSADAAPLRLWPALLMLVLGYAIYAYVQRRPEKQVSELETLHRRRDPE